MELRSHRETGCEQTGESKKAALQRLWVRIPGLGDPRRLSYKTQAGDFGCLKHSSVIFTHSDDGSPHHEMGCLGVRGIREAQDLEQHLAPSEYPWALKVLTAAVQYCSQC